MKNGSERESSLLPAVQRFVKKFTEATGIAVHIEAEGDIRVNDRLAAEVFQMVAEGLSNIRRHTYAAQASIGLLCHSGHLTLRIENEGEQGSVPASFTPRSITDRAVALGRQAHVEQRQDSGSVVVVEIPL